MRATKKAITHFCIFLANHLNYFFVRIFIHI